MFVVFLFNSLGGTTRSLLAIIVTFTAIIAFIGSVKIYRSAVVNAVEISVYLNFSAATITEFNSPALVYLLLGIILVTMVCIIAYQLYFLYIGKTALWKKSRTKLSLHLQKAKTKPVTSHNPHTITVDLREPLLDMYM